MIKPQKISTNVFFIILAILLSSNMKVLLAQEYEYYPSEEAKSIITASADNYFPKLNEPVKLKLKIIIPRNSKAGEIALGFDVWDGKNDIEILSGQRWNKGEFKKDQIIEMQLIVKFTKRKTMKIQAHYSKDIFVMLPFYVSGAFRESEEIKDLRYNIEKQKEWIQSDKNDIPEDFFPMNRGSKSQNVTKHNIQIFNDYEQAVLKETIKQNIELHKTLKKEYDSLDTIIKGLARERKKNNYQQKKMNEEESGEPDKK